MVTKADATVSGELRGSFKRVDNKLNRLFDSCLSNQAYEWKRGREWLCLDKRCHSGGLNNHITWSQLLKWLNRRPQDKHRKTL